MKTKRLVSMFLMVVIAIGIIFVPNNGLVIESSAFTARTSVPNVDNRYYIKTTHSNSRGERGLNECILGNSQRSAGDVMSNCVGYAWGRAYEIMGSRPTLSKNNASTFWGNTSDGYQRGQIPKVGAIVCWSGGSEGAGHVAVVESISSNGSQITISESSWSSYYWRTRTVSATNPAINSSYTFQGYIYLPITSSCTHSDVVNQTITYPSCTSSGTVARICLSCNVTLSTYETTGGHTPGKFSCMQCTMCGSNSLSRSCSTENPCTVHVSTPPPTCTHSDVVNRTITHPNCTQAGLVERICLDCNVTLSTYETSALGHSAGRIDCMQCVVCGTNSLLQSCSIDNPCTIHVSTLPLVTRDVVTELCSHCGQTKLIAVTRLMGEVVTERRAAKRSVDGSLLTPCSYSNRIN